MCSLNVLTNGKGYARHEKTETERIDKKRCERIEWSATTTGEGGSMRKRLTYLAIENGVD